MILTSQVVVAAGAGTAGPESLAGSTAVELYLVAVGGGRYGAAVTPLVAVGGYHYVPPLPTVGGGHYAVAVPPSVAVGGGRYLTAAPLLSILVLHNVGLMASALSV